MEDAKKTRFSKPARSRIISTHRDWIKIQTFCTGLYNFLCKGSQLNVFMAFPSVWKNGSIITGPSLVVFPFCLSCVRLMWQIYFIYYIFCYILLFSFSSLFFFFLKKGRTKKGIQMERMLGETGRNWRRYHNQGMLCEKIIFFQWKKEV